MSIQNANSLPDLILENIYFTSESGSSVITENDNAVCHFTVRNQGSAASAATVVEDYGSSKQTISIASLEAGASCDYQFVVGKFSRGETKCQIYLDSDNVVAESDETNNNTEKIGFTIIPAVVVPAIEIGSLLEVRGTEKYVLWKKQTDAACYTVTLTDEDGNTSSYNVTDNCWAFAGKSDRNYTVTIRAYDSGSNLLGEGSRELYLCSEYSGDIDTNIWLEDQNTAELAFEKNFVSAESLFFSSSMYYLADAKTPLEMDKQFFVNPDCSHLAISVSDEMLLAGGDCYLRNADGTYEMAASIWADAVSANCLAHDESDLLSYNNMLFRHYAETSAEHNKHFDIVQELDSDILFLSADSVITVKSVYTWTGTSFTVSSDLSSLMLDTVGNYAVAENCIASGVCSMEGPTGTIASVLISTAGIREDIQDLAIQKNGFNEADIGEIALTDGHLAVIARFKDRDGDGTTLAKHSYLQIYDYSKATNSWTLNLEKDLGAIHATGSLYWQDEDTVTAVYHGKSSTQPYTVLTVDAGSPGTLVPTPVYSGTKSIEWTAVPGSEGYVVQYSTDSFNHSLTLATDRTQLETCGLPKGEWQWRVRTAESTEWQYGDTISQATSRTVPESVSALEDGISDIFFLSSQGIRTEQYAAQHVGYGDWTGTMEIVSLSGKNQFSDTITANSDINMLVLTDDANGDALFVDDIYTDFPYGEQSRIAQLDEIRAGAGDDVVDMTSQRFEYVGDGLTIRGGNGDDVIWANKGNNMLFGDAGNDRVVGASDDDVIIGGIGNDSMHGGGGSDIFCFCKGWGKDTVEQLSGSAVTLWFVSGSEECWDQSTMTYTAGANSVKVAGVDKVTLKFGDDGSEQYDQLLSSGAFMESSSEKIFEDSGKGILASL